MKQVLKLKVKFMEENIMELIIKGKPEEIKKVLQAIGSSKEHNEIENTVQNAISTANYALSLTEAAN